MPQGADSGSSGLLWTHVVSDGLTSVSYWAIAFILVYLVYRANREHADEAPGLKRLPYPWLFMAFGLFIMACGTVHFLLVWNVWSPVYGELGVAKAFMAVASVGTAIALPPLVPRVLRLLREARLSEERQRRLEEAHERVKEYDELKSQFFANVSHELRTPLTLILGPVEALLDSERPDRERSQLEVVRRNARLLRRHVEDLLDVSRLEAGHLAPTFAEVDLAQLVRLTSANFDGLALERTMTFEVVAPKSLPAQVDIDKVQRILLNFLANAFKFTPEGGTVRVVLGPDTSPPVPEPRTESRSSVGTGGWAVLEVRDSGPGIPHEERDLVFERFRQLEGGQTRRFGGTGLGLAIAKEFAELHGGHVRVEDAAEGGARLIAALPLLAPEGARVRNDVGPDLTGGSESATDRLAELEIRDPTASISGEARDRGRRDRAEEPGRSDRLLPHVLIVEDNSEMLHHLEQILVEDWHVTTAPDGEAALAALEEKRPDLVLTDVMMPRMSGERLVLEIRERDELRDVPVVVLTARADDQLRIRLLEQGAQDYIVKPFSPEELRARVRNLLQLKRSGDVLRSALRSRTQDLETLSKEIVRKRDDLRRVAKEARQARLEAEASDRAKSRFLSVMSHELRTPLNAILGYNELLTSEIMGAITADQKDYMARIQGNTLRLGAMIDQILELSRLDTDGLAAVSVKGDLADVIREAARSVEPEADRKNLSLLIKPPAAPAPIYTDTRKLRQILEHLLVNAVNFTPEGEVELEARLEEGEIVIRVRDTGIGMSEEELEHLFDPFWQAQGGLTRPVEGAGLGMTLGQRFAHQLGGGISAESVPGVGTTCTLRLPARLVNAAVWRGRPAR